MDLLYVNAPLAKTPIGGLSPSLTFLTLASHLARAGYRSQEIYDPAVDGDGIEGLTPEQVMRKITDKVVSASPKILAMSCKIPSDGRFSLDLARRVKLRVPGIRVLLGGLWSSAVWRELLERYPEEIDGVAVGEGELALEGLMERLRRGEDPFRPGIPGLAVRGPDGPELLPGRQVPMNDRAPLDVSMVPSPERYTTFPYLSSHGCPYRCVFCSEALIHPRYRELPLELVERDLMAIRGLGPDYFVWLSDPILGLTDRRRSEVLDIMARTGFRFLLEQRVDVLPPEVLPRLHEAGCDVIYFGLEAASQNTLVRLDKIRREEDAKRYLEGAKALVRGCIEADIHAIFGVIHPAPHDTPEDLEAAYRFLEEMRELGAQVEARTGTDVGMHIYSFTYRYLRGTRAWAQLPEDLEAGVTIDGDPEDILQRVLLHDASPSVPFDAAQRFHEQVRALNDTPSPKAYRRWMRSFPSGPYLGF